jgi:hypothetical protein
MVRPFTIATGSAKCAWDMAAFCKWVYGLSGAVTSVGSIIFNWLSCINEYHKLKEGNKR